MRSSRLGPILALTLGLALAAALGLALYLSRQLTVCRQDRQADLHSLQLLQEALHREEAQKAPVVSEVHVDNDRAALAKREATIALLNRELNDANTNATQLQSELSTANSNQQKALADAEERAQKERADLQGQIDALQKELSAAQADAASNRQRAADLQADNTKLHNQFNDDTDRAAELSHAAADLQDLNRRRDVYLTSIVRQYREITSQFRAMSGMLDTSRDQNSSAFSGAALTRIQNAISAADDDLRQLNDLNAQAHQLEKKLMQK
jgi:chromosome segregation ATPase